MEAAAAAAAAGSGDGNGSNGSGSGSGSGRGNWKDFECNICLDMAADPVVTACGHLFCWACLYQWLHLHSRSHECPVCKGLVPDSNIIPIYGRGQASLQIQVQAQAEPEPEEPEMATEAERALRIPKRPPAHRIQRFSDAIAQNHRREDVLARFRTLRDVLENGGHGHHSRPRVSALEHNSSGNNGGNSNTSSGSRRVRQRLGFDPDEILRHRMRYLASDAPEEESPAAAAAATPVFRSSVSAALSTRVRARARHRALLRSRAGGGSSSSNSRAISASASASIPFAFDDEDDDEDEDIFFERISASAAARSDPASASIFAPPSPPPPQAQAQGPSQSLGPAPAAIAENLFPRDNDEIARHLLLLRRGRESTSASASASASTEANVVVPPFAGEEDELIRRISLRQRRYLGLVRPILVDEVEERMARRLEHTLAREQEEIFRYLALIRRMRNSRLAAIRARLASMSGMHEISAVSERARADNAAASLRSENPAEMDLIGAVENAFAPNAVAEDVGDAENFAP